MSRIRSDYRYLERLRVRWAEVDMQKIVFNGHYLMYFDTAIAGYWRAMALPYAEAMHRLDGDLYVRKATLEYEGSARYDDVLEVGMRCARIGRSSIVFDAALFRGETLLVHGELVYVFADPATQTSRAVPATLRELLERHEAGGAMVDVETGDWGRLGDASRAIRDAVFRAEQGIAAELICDDADPGALHAVARNRMGMALGAGRLLPATDGVSKIGRMATLASVRGARIGSAVLDALVAAARDRGDRGAVLHAQASAADFYRRAGWTTVGEPFMEAGIPHVTMRLGL